MCSRGRKGQSREKAGELVTGGRKGGGERSAFRLDDGLGKLKKENSELFPLNFCLFISLLSSFFFYLLKDFHHNDTTSLAGPGGIFLSCFCFPPTPKS